MVNPLALWALPIRTDITFLTAIMTIIAKFAIYLRLLLNFITTHLIILPLGLILRHFYTTKSSLFAKAKKLFMPIYLPLSYQAMLIF